MKLLLNQKKKEASIEHLTKSAEIMNQIAGCSATTKTEEDYFIYSYKCDYTILSDANAYFLYWKDINSLREDRKAVVKKYKTLSNDDTKCEI